MNDNAMMVSVGGEVKVVGQQVGGKLFVFTPHQHQFLLNLQKLKSVAAAAMNLGKDEAWGQAFLKSAKFKRYLNAKMKAFSDRNGLDVEWWYGFGKKLSEGCEDVFAVSCGSCSFKADVDVYDVEQQRKDDMTLEFLCPACYAPVEPEAKKIPFKPSREQVEGWKELGSRLIPKIERVHHVFSNEEIIFEAKEGE